MNVSIDVKGARELRVAYDDAPALVASTALRVMRRIVGRLQSYVVARKLNGVPLQARTRNLARSVFSRVEIQGRDLVGRVGFDLKKAIYGRIHELGGVVTPKRAKNLTIPVGNALTASGVPRFDAREFITATRKGGAGIHGFTHSFVNKNKTAIIGVRKSGTAEAVFLLRQRVVIPASHPLEETLSENVDEITDALRTGVVEAVRTLKRVG